MEDAATEDAQDDCGGDLEAVVFKANQKLDQAWRDGVKFIERLRIMRNPCSGWEKLWRYDRCDPKNFTTGE